MNIPSLSDCIQTLRQKQNSPQGIATPGMVKEGHELQGEQTLESNIKLRTPTLNGIRVVSDKYSRQSSAEDSQQVKL
ncbi:hypothetical protein E2C01_088056 [Portunus trituberculatus]|uniref:Uncharacterized protein n=1 Tax=Portunus trituberculatus TaxID=210409 RepID=A0A5B7JEY1_PORTR|nr:hypothetical protein [Portunus trituberculatus]